LIEQKNITRCGLAAWHLPGGPVGSPSRQAATLNVEVGQTTYTVNRRRVRREGREGERGTKSPRGGEGKMERSGGGTQVPLARKGRL